jgi:hypothetical protein
LVAIGDDAHSISSYALGCEMNPACKACAIAALVVASDVTHAAPPTVMPSPGYDARLKEQRDAASRLRPPASPPVTARHRRKPKRN